MRRWGAILVVTSLALAAVPMTAGAQEATGTVLVYTNLEAEPGFPWARFAAATNKTVQTSPVLPASLSGYDCVILPANSTLPEGGPSQLASYVSAGGRLLALGENAQFFSAAIATMNGLADTVGSSMALQSSSINPGFNTTTLIDESPFTLGVSAIRYAFTTGIAVIPGPSAHSLVRISGGETVIVAVEQIGLGVFALSGDTNIFSDNSDSGYTTEHNGVLAANICDSASFAGGPEDDVDLSITKVAEQETVTAGAQAAFTITVTNNNNVEGAAATDVTVNDSAFFSNESSVAIVSASGDGWECGIEGSASCFLGDLAAGATSSELLVIVQAPDTAGSITNTATVSGDQTDPNDANNTATAGTTVEDEVAEGSAEITLDEPNDAPITLATTLGQPGWDTKMLIPAGSPAGTYRLTELEDPVAISKGSVEYQAPPGALVTVEVTCAITQCPKRRFLDLVMIVIKTDEDRTQHILPPCHLVIKIGRRTFTINREAPCVVSVTRAGNTAPLIWTVKVKGGPDPGVRGR